MAAPHSFKDNMKQNPFQGGGLMPSGGLGNIADSIREFINTHKVESLGIALTLGFLFGAYLIFSDRITKVQELDAAIGVLKDKDASSREYRNVQKNMEELLKDIPAAVADNRFVVLLTQLAEKRSVVIASLNPPKSRRESFYSNSEVEMSFTAPSFRDGMLFLKDIETLPFSMRIMSLHIRSALESVGGGILGDDTVFSKQGIEMKALFSSVALIENDKKTSEKK